MPCPYAKCICISVLVSVGWAMPNATCFKPGNPSNAVAPLLVFQKSNSSPIGVEMMPRTTSYHEELIKDLKNPLEAAFYIEIVLEEGD